MDVVKVVSTLIGLAVIVGVLTMVLKNPSGANSLLSSGTDVITGVTTKLEGR